ncbi:replication-relaxation family protein [Streptomyces megasporus]|uniref:replication-relaxation family protein n=1 Tax=Streptomyces megasporus TaxID=44060 RepID=UPI00068EBB51|nr:replication-relaxation family protein [Streptomyces megasporus]
MPHSAADTAPRRTAPVREQVLACLFQHRAATTVQLLRMLTPRPHPEYLRKCLRALRRNELAASIDLYHRPSVWFLTDQGRATVAQWPQFVDRRPHRAGRSAMGMRSLHTLTVTRTALAFLADAQARGDDFSPLDWTPEVSHPIRDGAADGRRMLVADALLRYTRVHPSRALLRAFVEVDRATQSSEQLASKLIAYARFHSAPPIPSGRHAATSRPTVAAAWQRSYPVFPRVLFVLTGAGPRALTQRIADLQTMVRQHPLVEQFAAEVPLGAAVLEDLEQRGASAAVWSALDDRTGRFGWMDL